MVEKKRENNVPYYCQITYTNRRTNFNTMEFIKRFAKL